MSSALRSAAYSIAAAASSSGVIFWFIPIEVMTRDVLTHRVGRQIADRLPLPDPVAQHRRRDSDLWHVEKSGVLGALQLAQRPLDGLRSGARSPRNRQRSQRQNPLGIAPPR